MLATDELLKELGISKEQSGCSTGKTGLAQELP